jgi:hypothetical protein
MYSSYHLASGILKQVRESTQADTKPGTNWLPPLLISTSLLTSYFLFRYLGQLHEENKKLNAEIKNIQQKQTSSIEKVQGLEKQQASISSQIFSSAQQAQMLEDEKRELTAEVAKKEGISISREETPHNSTSLLCDNKVTMVNPPKTSTGESAEDKHVSTIESVANEKSTLGSIITSFFRNKPSQRSEIRQLHTHLNDIETELAEDEEILAELEKQSRLNMDTLHEEKARQIEFKLRLQTLESKQSAGTLPDKTNSVLSKRFQ